MEFMENFDPNVRDDRINYVHRQMNSSLGDYVVMVLRTMTSMQMELEVGNAQTRSRHGSLRVYRLQELERYDKACNRSQATLLATALPVRIVFIELSLANQGLLTYTTPGEENWPEICLLKMLDGYFNLLI